MRIALRNGGQVGQTLLFGAMGLVLTTGVIGAAQITSLPAPTHKFTQPEAGEEFPGGQATSRKSNDNRDAFSHSSGNLSFDKELDFKVGNAIFRKAWISAPASTKSSDGLGPLFNARSCQRCHLKDGRGHPPVGNWPEDDAVSMFLRLSVPPETINQRKQLASQRINVIPEPTYGGQLQDFAIKGHLGEGRMQITYQEVDVLLADGEVVRLRKPTYRVSNLGYGPLHPKTMMSPRVAPQMIGLGLLEAVPEAQITTLSDARDGDGDGISGRPNRVWSSVDEQVRLGRFGWKAGAPSVLQQSAEAFAGDVGIASWLVPKASGDCTDRQPLCLNAPNGNAGDGERYEVSPKLLDLVTFYSSNLAVPRRRGHNRPDILRGKQTFYEIGCASCHNPKFKTGRLEGQPHLTDQLIWPYTDLLLHDMGDGLADGRPEGLADGREWRTAPLWGIGLTEIVSGHTFFLHDGRARSIKEAILWHAGEAEAAKNAFAALPREDRERLIAFVNSL